MVADSRLHLAPSSAADAHDLIEAAVEVCGRKRSLFFLGQGGDS